MLAPALHLVGRQQAVLGGVDGERGAQVQHVGGAGLALQLLTALISSWLLPSGFSELILMPYFLVKSLMIVP